MHDPIAGKYQKRSARIVGRSTGMFDTGKNDTQIHKTPAPITGVMSTFLSGGCGASRYGPSPGRAAASDSDFSDRL